MKIFLQIIAFFKWLFAPWTKVRKLENKITVILEFNYVEYELSNDINKLELLVKLVAFLEQCGINGSTRVIREKIKKEWKDRKEI